mmetsp:Transcript_23762/g.29226  ORF Transcript_23762/g.29226 Transcript_23762/m.29226 type:complete len:474 (+) Transcript_23762:845-2266(+)
MSILMTTNKKKKGRITPCLQLKFLFVALLLFMGYSYFMLSSLIHSRKSGANNVGSKNDNLRSQRISQFTARTQNDGNIHGNNDNIDNEKLENSSTQNTHPNRILHSDILAAIDQGKLRPYGASNVWEDIIEQGKQIMLKKKNNNNNKSDDYDKNYLTVIEVGAQSAKQCLLAAEAQFHTHCVEPSPKSFERMQREISRERKRNPSIQKYIHLYNVAAAAESGKTLDFFATGGTGDHVGEFDMWNMKPGKMPDEFPPEKRGEVIKVPSIKMDDLILYNKVQPFELQIMNHPKLGKGNKKKAKAFFPPPPKIDQVFALKIDTQGFEPSVFSGLSESIEQHKIQYIMTEYWPKGMDLIGKRSDQCELSVGILNSLADAGYKLYALPLVAHPTAFYVRSELYDVMNDWTRRPLHDFKADCMYLRNLEILYPNENYYMGYWTDILAVAPGMELFQPTNKHVTEKGRKKKKVKRPKLSN